VSELGQALRTQGTPVLLVVSLRSLDVLVRLLVRVRRRAGHLGAALEEVPCCADRVRQRTPHARRHSPRLASVPPAAAVLEGPDREKKVGDGPLLRLCRSRTVHCEHERLQKCRPELADAGWDGANDPSVRRHCLNRRELESSTNGRSSLARVAMPGGQRRPARALCVRRSVANGARLRLTLDRRFSSAVGFEHRHRAQAGGLVHAQTRAAERQTTMVAQWGIDPPQVRVQCRIRFTAHCASVAQANMFSSGRLSTLRVTESCQLVSTQGTSERAANLRYQG
jgi:hypothetical protein